MEMYCMKGLLYILIKVLSLLMRLLKKTDTASLTARVLLLTVICSN